MIVWLQKPFKQQDVHMASGGSPQLPLEDSLGVREGREEVYGRLSNSDELKAGLP